MYGRHFDHKDTLYSNDAVKELFKDDVNLITNLMAAAAVVENTVKDGDADK